MKIRHQRWLTRRNAGWVVVSLGLALYAVRAWDRTALSAAPAAEWTPPSGTIADVGLRIRSLGSGPPTIVLLHGLAGSNQYFGGSFDVLAQDGRLVAPDLVGFGDSPRPQDIDYGPRAHAEAVLAALQRLDIEPPVYVAAHSAGSLVALRLAALRPDWIRGLVLFGPPLYPSEQAARARIGGLGGMVRFFAMDTVWAETACKVLHRFSRLSVRLASRIRPDLPRPIAEDALKHSWESYSGTIRNLVLTSQPPDELDDLHIPVSFVVGAEDEIVDLEYLKSVSERHHVKLEVWQGGHDLPLTDASKAVAAIRSLIADPR